MAAHFSANQYEKEFKGKRLQNWEVQKQSRERPRALDGFTEIIASDRGHVMEYKKRSKGNPWGDFVGTWDLPLNVPGNRGMNPTARSAGAQRLQYAIRREGDETLSGWKKNMKPREAGKGKTIAEQVLGIDASDMLHQDIGLQHEGRVHQEPISMPDKATQYTKTDILKTPSPVTAKAATPQQCISPTDINPIMANRGPSPRDMAERTTPIRMTPPPQLGTK